MRKPSKHTEYPMQGDDTSILVISTEGAAVAKGSSAAVNDRLTGRLKRWMFGGRHAEPGSFRLARPGSKLLLK